MVGRKSSRYGLKARRGFLFGWESKGGVSFLMCGVSQLAGAALRRQSSITSVDGLVHCP